MCADKKSYTKILTGGCVCEGITSELLYFSVLFKFSSVSIYYFNIFRTFLNDGKVKKKRGQ